MKVLPTLIWLASLALPATAANFNVSPIRVGLSPQKPNMPLSITNEGDEAVVIQVKAMLWSQEKGEDTFQRSDEILATPPIFTVPAHGSQIIRVGLRRPFDPARELSYRIFLAEIPGAANPNFSGVQMSLTLSLPVFVSDTAVVKPVLQWRVVNMAGGAAKLELKNEGNAHVQVADIRLLNLADDQVIARQTTPAYLLPGTVREWPLQIEAGQHLSLERLRLQAYTDGGNVTTDVLPQQAN